MTMRVLITVCLLWHVPALADNPKTVIENGYAAIQKIVETDKNDESVRTKVANVLTSFTDFQEFGRLTLKRYWPDLSRKQRSAFVQRYEKLIHKSYAKHFKADQKLNLTFRGEPKIVRDKALVKTTVQSGKTSADVNYKLHQTDRGYLAYDIVIDDVSLLRSYRKQFSRIVKRDGFDILLKKMDKKIAGKKSDID